MKGSDMKKLDANTLVAYADGELDAESATVVETLLAADADASKTVRALVEGALLVRAAHHHVIYETVPDRLVDTVMMAVESEARSDDPVVPQHLVDMILDAPEGGEPMAEVAAGKGHATDSGARIIPIARRRSVAALATAAAFAAVMLGSGFLLGQYQSSEFGRAPQAQQVTIAAAVNNPWREAAFQEALETKASDTAVVWTNPETGYGGAIIPVKTYRRADGTFCRAFRSVEAMNTPQQPNYGIACREQGPEGRWIKTVEAVADAGSAPKLSF